MKEHFLNYLHYFRGFAIMLIVGVHCRTSIPWPAGSITHDVLFYGLDFATILFVFISGFLFQYLHQDRLEYSSYLVKKIKHVILPYILVSIPALLDKLFIETNAPWMTDFYKSLSMPLQALYMLATGKHSGPFYFIPMISIIFIMAPLFFGLQKSRLFMIVAFLIIAFGMFSYNYGYYATIWESLIYFIPVYLFGVWAGRYRSIVVDLNPYLLFLFVLVYLVIFSLEIMDVINVYRLKTFGEPQYFMPEFNWGKFKVMCLAIILLNLFYRLRQYHFNALIVLGNFSFGIYFIHIYFINATELFLRYFRISIQQNLILFLGYTSAVIIASMLSIYVVKKIFGRHSRLIVGS